LEAKEGGKDRLWGKRSGDMKHRGPLPLEKKNWGKAVYGEGKGNKGATAGRGEEMLTRPSGALFHN